MVISRFAVASRWHALLRATCVEVSWGQSVRYTFAGLFATNFLPSTIGGDIIRLAGVVRSGVDAATATASLVMDRLVGMFGMVLALPFGILPLLNWFSTSPAIIGFSSNYDTLMVSVPIFKKIWMKVFTFTKKTFQSIKLWLGQPASIIQSLLFTGIHMVCFFGIFWILLAGLNDPIPFSLAAGLYSFVYLVTLLPISINGYGLQELSISVIFSEVGGITLQNSLTLALIFRTMTILASLPGAFFLSGLFSRRQDDDTPQA
jgi:uncharacterized membrane protein YbhN (UPF0104 family)